MTIVLLQKRKLGTNVNNLSKVLHLVDVCTRVRTRDLVTK